MARRILFVLPIGPSLGGVTTWSISLANALRRAGYNSQLLIHQSIPRRPTLQLSTEQPAIYCKGPPAFFASTKSLSAYTRLYEQQLPATFIPNWSDATYYTCSLVAANHPSKVRIIGVAHADEDYYYELLCRYEKSIHIFVAVSQSIAGKLKALLPHRAGHIYGRPNFVDFIPAFTSRLFTGLVITYAGRIEEDQKRVSDLVEIIRILKRSGLEYILNVVGDGDRLPWLRSQLQEILHDSCCRVIFHGVLPHAAMLRLWSQSHIMLQCSAYEGTSLAMLEAMASGCVPVVTAVSGAKDLIVHGENGFLAPVGDVSSLADSILKLADDHNLLSSIAFNAHQTILRHCVSDDYAQWFLSLETIAWAMDDRSHAPQFQLPHYPRQQNGYVSALKTYLCRSLNLLTSTLRTSLPGKFHNHLF